MEHKEKDMMHGAECGKDCGCHGKSGKGMMSMHKYHKCMKTLWFIMMLLITISVVKMAFGGNRYDDMRSMYDDMYNANMPYGYMMR